MSAADKRDAAESTKAFRVVSCSDGLGIVEVGSVCLVVWRAAVSASRFQRQRLALDNFVERYSGRAGLICVIEASAPPPEERMRKASTDLLAKYGDRMRGVACVIEASGIRGGITRSVLIGMSMLLSKQTAEVKFMATVAAAAAWMELKCNGASALSLLQADKEIRLRLDSAAP